MSASPALANDKVNQCFNKFKWPQPTTQVLQDGTKYTCFKFEDLTNVVEFTNCGITAANLLNICESKTKKLQSIIDLRDQQVDLLKKNNKILKDEKSRLFDRWKEENEKRHEAENKADWSWIGWTAAGVLAVSTVTLGVVVVVK